MQGAAQENQPCVTIVTINRNNAPGLLRTIHSVRPLISARVSYVVIDGASTDDSPQVAASLLEGVEGGRLISEPDSGIYSAMNKGWREANGKYIAYINSGDELIPEAFGRFVDLASRSEVDVIYAKTLLVSPSGAIAGSHERHPWHLHRDTLPHPATLVRRTTMHEIGGFDESYAIAADRDLFVRLQKSGASFDFFPEDVSVFYLGGISSGWQARLEFSRISHRHGYIGFTGWVVRVLLYKYLKFHPSIIDDWLPLKSKLRLMLSRFIHVFL